MKKLTELFRRVSQINSRPENHRIPVEAAPLEPRVQVDLQRSRELQFREDMIREELRREELLREELRREELLRNDMLICRYQEEAARRTDYVPLTGYGVDPPAIAERELLRYRGARDYIPQAPLQTQDPYATLRGQDPYAGSLLPKHPEFESLYRERLEAEYRKPIGHVPTETRYYEDPPLQRNLGALVAGGPTAYLGSSSLYR